MKKFLLLIFMTLIFAGCGSIQENKTLQPLQIGLMPDTDSVPFIIAQEKGYFAEEGVQVELKIFKSAMDRDSALQSGNLDGAVSDMLAAAFAKDGGFDVTITSSTDGSYRLIAGQNETAATVAELAGKDVSVSRNTIIEYVTDRILEANAMTGDSINKVIIPQIPTRLEMLQNGKLSAATLPEPMASIAIHNGCKFITDSTELGINPGVVIVMTSALQDKKNSVQAMYRAYNKAVKYLNETPREEYIDLVIEKIGFPPATKEALGVIKYREATLPEESDIAACIEWLNEKSLVQEKFSYKDLVTDVLK